MRAGTLLAVLASALIGFAAITEPCLPQGNAAQVAITNIVADGTIQGTATGLPAAAQRNACVVVYVHTDIWYIHPYANAGQGQSFTPIDAQGNWQLDTVRRQFPANRVAALVMADANACENVPDRIADVRKIQNPVALKVYDLKGDGSQWFGRL
jgi:hypothetical protein